METQISFDCVACFGTQIHKHIPTRRHTFFSYLDLIPLLCHDAEVICNYHITRTNESKKNRIFRLKSCILAPKNYL